MSADDVTLSATSFLDGLGVDTHIPYMDGEYSSTSRIISDLQYLGIDNVRDGISVGAWGSAPLSHYISIAQAGIKFTFLIGNWVTSNSDIEVVLDQQIKAVEAAVPGSVIAIEGANEVNNDPVTFDGLTGLQGALALQADLYADVKADPALAGVTVDYFTGYDAGTIGVGPDLSTTTGLADDDTQHPYPNYNEAPEYWVSRAAALPNASSGNTPAVYTETGYSSNNVNEYVQEVYTLDLLMDTARQGISQTYLYDLMDAYAPGSAQGDDGYGLFDYTGAPKPVAVGIHNLTSILSQTIAGDTYLPAEGISYNVTGLPGTGQSMMLTKSDGEDVIALWAEPALWDNSTGSEIAAPTESVTISLNISDVTLSLYDPTIGTAAIETVTDVGSVTISLSDHPVFLEISGEAAPILAGHALCFTAGTQIAVPGGTIPVENLTPGQLVLTPSGPQPVRWLGERHYEGRQIAGNHLMLPVCIRSGALAGGVPCRDLWVSPGHGIWLDDVLVPAWRLVNGVSILQPPRAGQVDYYHIELAQHGLVFAENCAAETYLDQGSRAQFANAAQAPAMPQGRALRRLEDGYQLYYIQQRVNARAGLAAAEPAPAEAAAGALRGYVDITGGTRLAGWAQDAGAPETPVCLDILLDGAFLTSVLANRYRADLRAAGLGSGTHGFELTLPHPGHVSARRTQDGAELPLTDAALGMAA